MSKKSQREAREKKEEDLREREAKFSSSLIEWLQVFAEYYRQDPPTENGMLAYKAALDHLTPAELSIGCKEALKTCAFIPKAHEIIAGLRAARERTLAYGHSPVGPSSPDDMTKQEREDIARQILEIGKKLSMPKLPKSEEL